MDNIQQLKQWIDGSDRIVFFGGAGVSTEPAAGSEARGIKGRPAAKARPPFPA